MAIAPSKLGHFVRREWSSDETLLHRLREVGLVNAAATDNELTEAFRKARQEDSALSEDVRSFNSPHERVRVFLASFLSDKGRQWAVPLKSLDLPDD